MNNEFNREEFDERRKNHLRESVFGGPMQPRGGC